MTKLPKCVKCRTRTVNRCHYCGDAVCYYHCRMDVNLKMTCGPCNAKFYIMWQREKDEEHSTELEYQEWLKANSERELAG